MSRTYRRRGQRHDYDLVLRDYRWINGVRFRFSSTRVQGKDGARLPVFTRTRAGRGGALRRAGTGASSIIACVR
jgi:hypothetical protein